MFFIGFSGDFNERIFMGFSRENTMHMAWKSHEKTLRNKKPMKMPWNKTKPAMFFSWLFQYQKALFHGVRIYGVFMGVFKFMPHKKEPWVCCESLNINGWWKMKWLLMTFSLPMNYAPCLCFMGKKRHGHHENLVLNYSPLLNQIHCLWLLK